MDTIWVVVHLTGLLMFTAAQPDGRGPTHVLMPVTNPPLREHVAQIGFWQENDANCDHWNPSDEICYLNLKGWSVELGTPGNARPTPLPAGNISHAGGDRPVTTRQFAHNPFSAVRGRVTLNEGVMTDTCALAEWDFDGERVPLANVVTWRYPLREPQLTLTRTALNTGPFHRSRSITLTPIHGKIDLFVRQIPADEQDMVTVVQLAQAQDDSAMRTTDSDDEDDEGAKPYRATHFRAYYALLSPSSLSGPLPTLVEQHRLACTWAESPGPREKVRLLNAGTLSCMVALGEVGQQ